MIIEYLAQPRNITTWIKATPPHRFSFRFLDKDKNFLICNVYSMFTFVCHIHPIPCFSISVKKTWEGRGSKIGNYCWFNIKKQMHFKIEQILLKVLVFENGLLEPGYAPRWICLISTLHNSTAAFCVWVVIQGHSTSISENTCSEDDFRSRIFETFVVKFRACLPLLGFSKI